MLDALHLDLPPDRSTVRGLQRPPPRDPDRRRETQGLDHPPTELLGRTGIREEYDARAGMVRVFFVIKGPVTWRGGVS
jgi:hypothetical protein